MSLYRLRTSKRVPVSKFLGKKGHIADFLGSRVTKSDILGKEGVGFLRFGKRETEHKQNGNNQKATDILRFGKRAPMRFGKRTPRRDLLRPVEPAGEVATEVPQTDDRWEHILRFVSSLL